MRALVLAPLAALSIAACSGVERKIFSPAFPEDVDLAAVLTFDAQGELSAATGLVRWREVPFFELAEVESERVSTIVAAGWRSSDLTEVLLPRDDVLASTPLHRAARCDPHFPDPVSTIVFEGVLPSGPGPLSTNWLEDNCPQVQDKVFAHVPCVTKYCPPIVEQHKCRLTVNLDACDFGTQALRVGYRGELCVETPASFCVEGPAEPPALAHVDCTTSAECAIDFYATPSTPRFVVETRDVLNVPPRTPGNLLALDIRTTHPMSGYLTDIAVLPDRIAVASLDGGFIEQLGCLDMPQSRLHFFARDDLRELGTATTAGCLRGLLALDDRIFGVFGGALAESAGIFDREGHLVAAHRLDLPQADTRYYNVAQARRSRQTNEIFVLWDAFDTLVGKSRALMTAIDPADFSLRILYDVAGRSPSSFDEDDSGHLAIPNDSDDNLIFAKIGDASPLMFDIPHFGSVSVAQAEYHRPSSFLTVVVPTEEGAVHVYDREPSYKQRANFYEHAFAPLVTGPWPFDQQLMIAGGADNHILEHPIAAIALFDPLHVRFLPGAMDVGFGITGRFVAADEAVYTTLPWEAKLLRITAQP